MTRLQKEIEFPLFHLGTVPDSTGKPVTFTPGLLREMERNSNFVARAGILQAPVKYDHPAFGAPDKENHGKMVRYQVRNNSLFAVGTNWSERLQQDKAREARIAYSPEFVSEFTYIDPTTNQTVKLGPTVVGLAMLGGDRPAIKNLRPVSQFEFGENVGPADAFLMREELQNSGMLSEYCEDARYFAEVTNDARRFFSEHKDEENMDDKEVQRLLAEQDKKWSDRFEIFQKETEKKVHSFSEESKRVAKVDGLVAKLKDEKPIGQIALDAYRVALLEPTEANVQAFAEKLPAFIAPGGMAGAGDNAGDDEPTAEPKALASVRVKHFSDRSKYEVLLSQATADLAKMKPKLFSEAKATTVEQRLAVTKQYVVEREAAAN